MKMLLLCICLLCASGARSRAQDAKPPSNPAPTIAPTSAEAEDAEVRALLRQADRVKLEVESVGVDENGYGVPVTKEVATLSPGNFDVALGKLQLRPFHDGGFGTSTNPILYFVFLKEDRELGLLSLGYNGHAAEHWISAPNSKRKRERRDLNPEAVLPLRLWVGAHQQLQKTLLRLGAERGFLRPDLRQPAAQQ